MLVHLEDILPEGIEVEVYLEPGDSALKGLDVVVPVKGTFRINRTGHQVLVRGRVSGEVKLECARCLQNFTAQFDELVDIELRPAGELERTAHEHELVSGDLDIEFFRGDALDIGHLAGEQITLAIPMKPLCREDCSGICPGCGADRSQADCACEPDTDPRWTALKDLKDQMNRK